MSLKTLRPLFPSILIVLLVFSFPDRARRLHACRLLFFVSWTPTCCSYRAQRIVPGATSISLVVPLLVPSHSSIAVPLPLSLVSCPMHISLIMIADPACPPAYISSQWFITICSPLETPTKINALCWLSLLELVIHGKSSAVIWRMLRWTVWCRLK